ncbi:MAG: deoxyribodipyrimidine photo-lyase [Acidisphaera sp.]|nr:deoxyribodipyrimidine photo-lyase [Acidisphaera sp.]
MTGTGATLRTSLLWFTRDLRLHDNPALQAALREGGQVVALYVLDDATAGRWAPGGAHRWWLHQSLTALARDLCARGGALVLRRGDTVQQIGALIEETGAASLHVGQPHEPWARRLVDAVEATARTRGVALHRHRTMLLFEPDALRTRAGGGFGVYTPFARACLARGVHEDPLPAPAHIPCPAPPPSDCLADWGLLPRSPDWAGGLRATWQPGEAGAARRLDQFIGAGLPGYAEARDRPGEDATSMLSPHLHWGEMPPGKAWREASCAGGHGLHRFLAEVLWREFCAHLLWHRPELPEAPLQERFAAMPWRRDPAGLRAWQRGRTGIPIVDAGMRQLWHIGWQHNRVRMIAASFLTKHLLIDWRDGEAWFWDTLVDGDLASNAAGWQWVAGSGADPAPFFRIFNPVLQGKKFDPEGRYVRRWVPELAALPDRFLHAPWELPAEVLEAAGVRLGRTYPRPVVDLAAGRRRALAAFEALGRTAA